MSMNLQQALCAVPRVSLASLPTPLERLRQSDIFGPDFYIKRDDLTGLGPGGNKLRSLEFLLGEALEQGADTILTAGPVQSNLCTLTAAACARLGLRCILIHNGDVPDRREGNVLLNHLLGAESHYLGPVSAAERTAFLNGLEADLSRQCHPYSIRNGATSGRGALGYVAAVPELMQQMNALGLPELTLYVPGGNGGVASGLVYGSALCGLPFHIVVVSVEDSAPVLAEHIRHTVEEIALILSLPVPVPLEEVCTVDDRFRGGGWGRNTPESQALVTQFARTQGILIENVYNSKVLVGLAEDRRTGRCRGPACFLHTGGFGSLFAQY